MVIGHSSHVLIFTDCCFLSLIRHGYSNLILPYINLRWNLFYFYHNFGMSLFHRYILETWDFSYSSWQFDSRHLSTIFSVEK